MILMTSLFNLEQNLSTSLLLVLPCLAFTGFLATIYYSKPRQPGLRSKLYSAILISVLFVLVSEMIYIISLGYFNSPVISNIIVLIHWLGFIMWVGLYCIYCFVYLCDLKFTSFKELFKGSHRTRIIIIGLIFTFLAYLVFPKSNFEVTSSGFISGTAEYVALACLTLMCFCVLVATHTTCRKYPIRRRVAISLIMLVMAIMLIAQILVNKVSIYVICSSLQVFFLYFIIENPDIHLVNEIESLKTDIDKSNRSKTDFLSNMSHEIRTPMNAIVGFSDSLLNSSEFNEEAARNDIQSIATAGTNLVDIINNILDISKIESGNDTLVNKECSLDKIVKDLSSVIESRLGNSPVKLHIDMDEQIPSKVYGDATKIYQVLLNIANNAVKYTEVGKIRISMISEKTGFDTILLHVKISDTGYGIKKEDFGKLFEKFSRLDSAVSNEIEGTGLGLVITKRFVDLMGGKIWFESEYEVGTTFFVDLPLKVIDPTPIGNVSQTTVSARVKDFLDCTDFTALVVDDSALNLKVAERLLKKYNFSVDTATSGKDCVYKFKYGNHYDIIFLDHMMPEMDGIETVRILRRLDDYEIPPIIALTANVMNGMGEKYLSEGFDGYLPMPIDTLELDRIIHKFFGDKTLGVVGERSMTESHFGKPSVDRVSEVKTDTEIRAEESTVEKAPEVKEETETKVGEKPTEEKTPEVKEETETRVEEKPAEEKTPEVKAEVETKVEEPTEEKAPEVKEEAETKVEEKPIEEKAPEVKEETETKVEEKPTEEKAPEVKEKTETKVEEKSTEEKAPEVKAEVETKVEEPTEEKTPEVKEETETKVEEKPTEEKAPEVNEETETKVEEKPTEEKTPEVKVEVETKVEEPTEENVSEVKEETETKVEEKPTEEKAPEVKEETETKVEEKPIEDKTSEVKEETETKVEEKPTEEKTPEVNEETETKVEEKPTEEKAPEVKEKTETKVEEPTEEKTETKVEEPTEEKTPEVKEETETKVEEKPTEEKVPEVKEASSVAVDKSDAAMEKYLRDNGVDMDNALGLLGDMEMYNMTLGDFIADVPSKWSRINEYKTDSNMHDYAIEVHSLKSDCKYLGFMKLADISYQHELKSKENDSAFVDSNFEELVLEYEKILKLVNEYLDRFQLR